MKLHFFSSPFWLKMVEVNAILVLSWTILHPVGQSWSQVRPKLVQGRSKLARVGTKLIQVGVKCGQAA